MLRISFAPMLPAWIPGFRRRWASLLIVSGVLLPVTVLQPYANAPPIRSDGVGYHLWTYALLTGDPNFAWYQENPAEAAIYVSDTARPFWANKYPPGVALIRLPFMLPFVDWSQPPGTIAPGEHRMALILAALALLAVIALVLSCCRRLGVSNRSSHWAVLALTFGTGLFHYASYDGSFSHIYSALAVALLLWLSIRAVTDKDGRLPLTIATITIALLILIRNTNGIFVIIWATFFFSWAWHAQHPARRVWLQNAAAIAGGLALGMSLQLAINFHAHGRLTVSSYGTESFLWNRPMMGSVLLSYERGLFTYYPIFALVLALGVYVARSRPAALGLIVLVLAYAGLYGFWHSWMLGGGFGHRGFVEFMPVAMPLFAVSLDAVGRSMRKFAIALSSICVMVTVCLMGGYWCNRIPIEGVTADVYWQNCFRIDYVVRVWSDAKL